jgi:hypothetical protein
MIQISLRSRQGFCPYNYVKYNTFVTFYAWLVALSFPFLSFPFLSFPFLSFPFLSFPFLSFHIIFLLTSTAHTRKPISMVEDSNDAFPPKQVPIRGLIEKN